MKSRSYGNIVIYWFNLNEICECIFPCFYSFLLLLSNTILWSTSPYKNNLSLSHTETKDYLHIQVHGYTTCTYKLVHNNSKPFSSFFLSYSAIKFSYGFKHIFIFLDSWEYFKMFFKDWAARSCERKRKKFGSFHNLSETKGREYSHTSLGKSITAMYSWPPVLLFGIEPIK